MIGGIYKIVNKSNGKFYIGSAVSFKERWKKHKKDLRKGTHHSKYLQRAWNNYGEESFLFIVIEYVENKLKLINREQYYIDSLSPHYNVCKIAGSCLGLKHSIETRKIYTAQRLGKKIGPQTEEHKMNIRISKLGIIASDETKRKMSLSRRGVKRDPHSLETRKKIGDTQRGVLRGPLSEDHKKKIRDSKLGIPRDAATILKVSINKSKIPIDHITEIRFRVLMGEKQRSLAKEFGISPQSVCRIISGKRYSWVS